MIEKERKENCLLILFCITLASIKNVMTLISLDFLPFEYCYYQTKRNPKLCLSRHEIRTGCMNACNINSTTNYKLSNQDKYMVINPSCKDKSRCRATIRKFIQANPEYSRAELCSLNFKSVKIIIEKDSSGMSLSTFLRRQCKETCGVCLIIK